MLVASQVLLSIVLPFVIFPLVYLCSKDEIMTVIGPPLETETNVLPAASGEAVTRLDPPLNVETIQDEVRIPQRAKKSYASPKWVTWLGYAMFLIIVVANVYVIVELGLGGD